MWVEGAAGASAEPLSSLVGAAGASVPVPAVSPSADERVNLALALILVVLVALIMSARARRAAERERQRRAEVTFKPHQKALVLREAGGRCEYCHVRIKPGRPGILDTWKPYECDHILPVRLGGLPDLANAAAACKGCNQMKSGGTWAQFELAFKRVHGYRPRRPKGHAPKR